MEYIQIIYLLLYVVDSQSDIYIYIYIYIYIHMQILFDKRYAHAI